MGKKSVVIESKALFTRENILDGIERDGDDLLNELQGPDKIDGTYELYDADFVFDMADVCYINKSKYKEYTAVAFGSTDDSKFTVKIGWEEAKDLFRKSREDG